MRWKTYQYEAQILLSSSLYLFLQRHESLISKNNLRCLANSSVSVLTQCPSVQLLQKNITARSLLDEALLKSPPKTFESGLVQEDL